VVLVVAIDVSGHEMYVQLDGLILEPLGKFSKLDCFCTNLTKAPITWIILGSNMRTYIVAFNSNETNILYFLFPHDFLVGGFLCLCMIDCCFFFIYSFLVGHTNLASWFLP